MKNIIFSPQFSAFDDYWDDANSLQCGSGWGGWGDVERTCFSGVFKLSPLSLIVNIGLPTIRITTIQILNNSKKIDIVDKI